MTRCIVGTLRTPQKPTPTTAAPASTEAADGTECLHLASYRGGATPSAARPEAR
eukprot:CAMPEP_0185287712 /NCGR_PEP_ID=MMETSP1363-20130426/2974_1 /TAXON_ID=38817 /ORGANISM="Gephyrocapsa oceanica, Strain RCC1303" /LENGTH=53 /DNA_ID=CAMNT_0027883565 /DNA_START=8 /DNA_END=166 /DNA_ORIENTATION=-